uniref:Uncharacterized protein n=1 Tax=Cucumis melo TaxID=3656 RepID=A0A9I9E2L3_CUCME
MVPDSKPSPTKLKSLLHLLTHLSGSSVWRPFRIIPSLGCLILLLR